MVCMNIACECGPGDKTQAHHTLAGSSARMLHAYRIQVLRVLMWGLLYREMAPPSPQALGERQVAGPRVGEHWCLNEGRKRPSLNCMMHL